MSVAKMDEKTQETLNRDLMRAVEAKDVGRVKELLVRGANPNFWGPTQRGHAYVWELAIYLDASDILLLLSDHPAINKKPFLDVAVKHNSLACAKKLLLSGVDRMRLIDGKTCYAYSIEKGHAEMAELFIDPAHVILRQMKGSLCIEDTYDFDGLERTSLISGGGVAETSRNMFSELGDIPALRKAFNKYKERGGARTEEEVFGRKVDLFTMPPVPRQTAC